MVSPGGGEKVLLELHKLWPEAPIYTAAYEPAKFPEFAQADVRPTWLNKIGLAKRKHQLFSLARAWAFKGLNLSSYDLVISSTSAESKFVKTGPKTVHICYCHTPIRYYWSDYDWYRENPPFGILNPVAQVVLPILIPFLRRMDYQAAQKVDYFIANSKNVQQRIKKYYNRDSVVIYPPIDISRFKVATGEGEYYLVIGRQVAYKRLDLAVEVFNELGTPLVVAGVGEEIKRQQPKSKSNIKYVGRVTEADVPELYAKAKALIFPAEEDFGLVPVEAMASGRPVIAYAKGGALETVVDGVTGVLFKDQTKGSLLEAIKRAERIKFDRQVIRQHTQQFDKSYFEQQIRAFVSSKL
jgi:glycosyltransferase involved in cell wall biosynthesis